MGNEADSGVAQPGNDKLFAPGQSGASTLNQQHGQVYGPSLSSDGDFRSAPPGADGSRYYTIQRVNGSNGNGKADGTAGGHKHTLEDSDRVKKNSIQRHFLKEEKVKKRSQVSKSLPILVAAPDSGSVVQARLQAARPYICMQVARHLRHWRVGTALYSICATVDRKCAILDFRHLLSLQICSPNILANRR